MPLSISGRFTERPLIAVESPTRRTARFLKGLLEGSSELLAQSGLEVDWVFPSFRSETSVSVSFRDVHHRYVQRPVSHVVVTLAAGPGTPKIAQPR